MGAFFIYLFRATMNTAALSGPPAR